MGISTDCSLATKTEMFKSDGRMLGERFLSGPKLVGAGWDWFLNFT
ncbi:MAG: hypothetical protein QXF23_00975 [Candidatus Bathyarchaeia archaeon]